MINPVGGRVVVTASGVHDPESPGGAQGIPATLGDLSGLEKEGKNCEMIDGSPFNADKAYKDSKVGKEKEEGKKKERLAASAYDLNTNQLS